MLRTNIKIVPSYPAVLCLAESLCNPVVFDKVTVPQGVQKIYIDYLASPGLWDVPTLVVRLIELVKEYRLDQVVLA